jgi:outer membrane protein TolC
MRTIALGLAAALLAGCASFSPDGGFSTVQQTARERLGPAVELRPARSAGDQQAIATRVDELLAQPLSAESAVQLALLNHRGLQARFLDLGVSEAELVQASRLPNPGFSFGKMKQGEEIEWERGLHFGLTRLLALPAMRERGQRRFEQVQREVAAEVLAHAAETRRAWLQAVAAEESLRYSRQVLEAADTGAELARRMQQAGNFNQLSRAREQAFYADAALGVAQAERERLAARERLVRQLGLWGAPAARLTLPERLPELPETPLDRPDIEAEAIAQRLDVQAARLSAGQAEQELRALRGTRWAEGLELGWAHNSSNEAPRQTGWELGIELPIFDDGSARVARAEALHRQAQHRAAQAAIEARSEVREAYGQYRLAYDIARHHRDERVPLAQRIADEQLLRYNGMLIGVFELLADARAQVAAVNAAIVALRDFWLAQADLDQALVGKGAPMSPAAATAVAPAAAGGKAPH